MKSYWIAAAVLLVTVWPCSKAYAFGAQQSLADGKPVQQAQPSSASANLQNPVQASVTAAPILSLAASTTQAAPVKPKGSYMLVELSKPLKAKKLKVGDKVIAEVTQDVVAHGKVIIPIETRLVGHVTEVNARDKGQLESRLGIVFDRILLKHYHDISFQAVVQAVSQPVIRKSRLDEPSQMLPPSMVGGGLRSSTGTTNARGASTTSSRSSSGGGSTSSGSVTTFQVPLTVKESASPNTTSGALLEVASTGKPMSAGMPLGVFGIKGLGLTSEPSLRTPGPVIISNTQDVKLESGTQILLHVLKVEVQENVKPAKK
ncbi:MAG TPA: hypothetical protein VIK39_05575 [Candidatus Angelobacter sp.]